MNYTRRPNRPDSDVYREMRRQGLRRAKGEAAPLNPKLLVASIVVIAVLVVWLIWK